MEIPQLIQVSIRELIADTSNFVRRHLVALLASLLMMMLIALPNLLFPILNKDVYKGINTGNFGLDEYTYIAKGKDILEGHSVGNPILNVGKDGKNISQDYLGYVFTLPAKFLPGEPNVARIYAIWGAIGIFALVLLIYFFVLQLSLSGDRFLGIALSLFTTGAYTFLLPYLSRTAISPFSANLNMYARPVEPLWGTIFLFLVLNLLLKFVHTTKIRWATGAGIVFGLSFYVYFYTASYSFAVIIALAFILTLKKDWATLKKTLLILLLGLGIASYSIYQSLLSTQSEMTTLFYNLLPSHTFYFSKIAFGTIIFLLIFIWRNKGHKNTILMASIVLANWIVIDQQVITGHELQTMHYHLYFLIPASIILYCYLGYELIKPKTIRIICLGGAIAIAIVNTSYRQYEGYRATIPMKIYAQNYAPIVNFLNKDKDSKTILASDKFYPMMFLAFTNHDLFWSHYAAAFETPLYRYKDAFMAYTAINKEARENLIPFYVKAVADEKIKTKTSHYLTRPEYYYDSLYSYLETRHFNIVDKTFEGGIDLSGKAIITDKMSQEFLQSLDREFALLIQSETGIYDILKKDNVHYIVWDKKRQPEWDLSIIKGVEKVFSANDIDIYTLD